MAGALCSELLLIYSDFLLDSNNAQVFREFVSQIHCQRIRQKAFAVSLRDLETRNFHRKYMDAI